MFQDLCIYICSRSNTVVVYFGCLTHLQSNSTTCWMPKQETGHVWMIGSYSLDIHFLWRMSKQAFNKIELGEQPQLIYYCWLLFMTRRREKLSSWIEGSKLKKKSKKNCTDYEGYTCCNFVALTMSAKTWSSDSTYPCNPSLPPCPTSSLKNYNTLDHPATAALL